MRIVVFHRERLLSMRIVCVNGTTRFVTALSIEDRGRVSA